MKYKCFLCGIPKARKTCKKYGWRCERWLTQQFSFMLASYLAPNSPLFKTFAACQFSNFVTLSLRSWYSLPVQADGRGEWSQIRRQQSTPTKTQRRQKAYLFSLYTGISNWFAKTESYRLQCPQLYTIILTPKLSLEKELRMCWAAAKSTCRSWIFSAYPCFHNLAEA